METIKISHDLVFCLVLWFEYTGWILFFQSTVCTVKIWEFSWVNQPSALQRAQRAKSKEIHVLGLKNYHHFTFSPIFLHWKPRRDLQNLGHFFLVEVYFLIIYNEYLKNSLKYEFYLLDFIFEDLQNSVQYLLKKKKIKTSCSKLYVFFLTINICHLKLCISSGSSIPQIRVIMRCSCWTYALCKLHMISISTVLHLNQWIHIKNTAEGLQ